MARHPDQLTLDRMPTRLFACTPSRLAAFDCPRRYRFTYLDRPTPPKGPPWAHNTVGAVAHLALHRWWDLPAAHRTPDEGAALVERHWQQLGFRDDAQSLRESTRTAGWVRGYLESAIADGTVDPRVPPVGVERTVATRTESLAVSGRVDRVDDRGEYPFDERTALDRGSEDGATSCSAHGGSSDDADTHVDADAGGRGHGLVVVDYKTGRRPPTEDDARSSQALALYVLAVRRTLRRPCTRVELHHLPTGDVAVAEHTDASLQRHLQRAEDTAADIVAATDTLASGADPDEVFPARPSSVCSWCDFRQHCPEGRATSVAVEPWAGLAE